jgi:hypothetical protein
MQLGKILAITTDRRLMTPLVQQSGLRDKAEAGKAGQKGRWMEHESRRGDRTAGRQMRKAAVGPPRQATSVLRCRRPHRPTRKGSSAERAWPPFLSSLTAVTATRGRLTGKFPRSVRATHFVLKLFAASDFLYQF